MSKGVARTIVILLTLVLLAVTNPSPDRHKQAIRDEIKEREPVASVLGMGFLGSELASYHSFLVASYTELDGKRVTFGALGFVWVDYEALDL